MTGSTRVYEECALNLLHHKIFRQHVVKGNSRTTSCPLLLSLPGFRSSDALCWSTFTVRCRLFTETTFCQLMFLPYLWCSPRSFNFLTFYFFNDVGSCPGVNLTFVHANSDKDRKTESRQLQVRMQMINVTKEITRHRFLWSVSPQHLTLCQFLPDYSVILTDLAEDTNDWEVIIFLASLC